MVVWTLRRTVHEVITVETKIDYGSSINVTGKMADLKIASDKDTRYGLEAEEESRPLHRQKQVRAGVVCSRVREWRKWVQLIKTWHTLVQDETLGPFGGVRACQGAKQVKQGAEQGFWTRWTRAKNRNRQ